MDLQGGVPLKKQPKPRKPLAPRDHAVYALLALAAVALPVLAFRLLSDTLPAAVAAADRDVLLHSRLFFRADHSRLSGLPALFFAVWLLLFGAACVLVPWLNAVPIFGRRAKKQPRFPQPQDRRTRKRLLALGAPLLLLSLLSICPRHILHADLSIESRGVLGTVSHSYEANEISALELKTYCAAGGFRAAHEFYGIRAAFIAADGREYAFPIRAADGDDVLRALLDLRGRLSAVTVSAPIPLETVFREEFTSDAAQSLLRQLFSVP